MNLLEQGVVGFGLAAAGLGWGGFRRYVRRTDYADRADRVLYNEPMLYWDHADGHRVCKPLRLLPGPAIQRLIAERNGSFDA